MEKHVEEKKSFLVKLGLRIKELRKLKGMSQQELAGGCNYEKASMSRIESGKTNSTIFTLKAISVVLQVQLAELF